TRCYRDGVQTCALPIFRENPELIGHTDIVAVRRHTVTNHSLAHLAVRKRLDHLVLQRHAPDPAVWLDGHPFLPKFTLDLSLRSEIGRASCRETASVRRV